MNPTCRSLALILSLALLHCGGSQPPTNDAAPDATLDATLDAASDAPRIDAPVTDASGDAPSTVDGSACSAPRALCNGACIDTSSDMLHCGSCDNACPQGTACQGSQCICEGGGSLCGGNCLDVTSDALNCGACGNACAPGQACVSGSCQCSDQVVSFDADVAPLLANNCTNAGCHSGIKAKENLDLTLAKSYAALVSVSAQQCSDGRERVKPGDPSASYLMQKLLGRDLCTGTQMPKAGVTLPSADMAVIGAWICQGAAK